MPQTSAINLIAVSLLLSMSAPVHAQQSTVQVAQAQQTPSQLEQDYQNRLRAAKTPEERARIQAEHDRMMQQGAVPNTNTNAIPSGPGTGDGAMGGGAVPRGQHDSGGSDGGSGGGGGGGGGR